MFFVLSKVLVFLLSPLVWIITTFLYSVFCKNQQKRKKALITGAGLLIFFSNSFIINEAFLAWETPPISMNTLRYHETAIVLTGVTNNLKNIKDRVSFDKGADRVLHAVQLYRAGKIKRILISGGSSTVFGKKVPEADQLLKVFLYCGVPREALIVENKSRNTAESSRYSKEIIDRFQLGKEFLLITSSFHIRRSLKCFQKVGLKVEPYPVDFYTSDRSLSPILLILPSEYAISKWSILFHEVVGYCVYKIAGHI